MEWGGNEKVANLNFQYLCVRMLHELYSHGNKCLVLFHAGGVASPPVSLVGGGTLSEKDEEKEVEETEDQDQGNVGILSTRLDHTHRK